MGNEWRNYRDDCYWDTLASTSWIWACLVEARMLVPSTPGVLEAYDRSTLTLAQLPMEHGKYGADKRYERCRWEMPGVEARGHAEHPWCKRITKALLWESGSEALRRGVRKEDLVVPFSGILDARQDTVLLPHARVTQLGVLSDRAGDGLGARYKGALASGRLTLLDRETGELMTPDMVEEIDVASREAVERSLEAIRQLPGSNG